MARFAIPLDDYLTLVNMSDGTFGISYDISTPNTENDLPNGWNAHRSQTYKQIARRLGRGHFGRLQKSDWYRNETDAVTTYYTMLGLLAIPPPGKFQTTVNGLKMHRIDNWIFNVTARVRFGGVYAPTLVGLIPRALAPFGIASVQPQAGFVVPPYTGRSAAASMAINWREAVE